MGGTLYDAYNIHNAYNSWYVALLPISILSSCIKNASTKIILLAVESAGDIGARKMNCNSSKDTAKGKWIMW